MIKVFMCGPIASSGGVSTHTKYLSSTLLDLGVKIIFYDFSGKSTIKVINYIVKTYRRTFGLIWEAYQKKKEYDIIHVQCSGGIFSFISAVAGCVASIICDTKFIFTFHNAGAELMVKRYEILFSFVLKYAYKIILVSNKQKDAITRKFPYYSNKIIVIPNGFSPSLFVPMFSEKCKRELNIPSNKKIILTVGNLLEIKGHKYLIEAMSIIVEKRKDVFCIIVGGGELENKLKKQIESASLEKYIFLAGMKPHEEIPLWLNASDLFVLPSLNEGNPTVMFEALGLGLPFIGTNVGGIPEIIVSDDYGFLIESKNSKLLAEKILVALDKRWDREKIQKYSSKFTWESIALKTLSIYDEM